MPFVKLDCGMLNSTLWFEREARDIFITALLMAEPYELREPTPQIHVDSLEYTGWVVPPGWYGFVPAAGVGIIGRARVDQDAGYAALRTLGMPDTSSRTPDFEGRRLVRIDGGYIVLNFIKYRDKDATAADRQRRWRERQKARKQTSPSRVTQPPLRVISNQAEAEAEAEADKGESPLPPFPRKELTEDEAFGPLNPVDAMAGWFVQSYPLWFSEERHGARYLPGPRDFVVAKNLVTTWPDQARLELLARTYLRSERLNKDPFHSTRSIGKFGLEASGVDAYLRETGQ